MCFGGNNRTPKVTPPTPPPAPAPVQKLEPTKPPTATPAPEQATEEKAAIKKPDTGKKKRQRFANRSEPGAFPQALRCSSVTGHAPRPLRALILRKITPAILPANSAHWY